MAITVTQSWKRNTPSTVCGESITATVTYYSFNKEEIDNLETKMPKGIIQTELSTGSKLSKYFDKLSDD